jgi:hypothetical protein
METPRTGALFFTPCGTAAGDLSRQPDPEIRDVTLGVIIVRRFA